MATQVARRRCGIAEHDAPAATVIQILCGCSSTQAALAVPSARVALRLHGFLTREAALLADKEAAEEGGREGGREWSPPRRAPPEVHDWGSHGVYCLTFDKSLEAAAKAFWQ